MILIPIPASKLSSSSWRSAKCFRLKAGPLSRKRMITSFPSMTTRMSAVLIPFWFLVLRSIALVVNSSAQILERYHFRPSILCPRQNSSICSLARVQCKSAFCSHLPSFGPEKACFYLYSYRDRDKIHTIDKRVFRIQSK